MDMSVHIFFIHVGETKLFRLKNEVFIDDIIVLSAGDFLARERCG